jgi:hypothetical protein
MDITQITVTIHEKRNHPSEYGHYDASVTLVANLRETDDPRDVVVRLRNSARKHVRQECDGWIASIKEQERISSLIAHAESHIRSVSVRKLHYAKLAVKFIRQLPGEHQRPLREKLRLKLAEVPTPSRVSPKKEDIPF